jgi:hypothetical protein
MQKETLIHNGDHLEYELEHQDVPARERPDWPLPSFDAKDWAEAFCTWFPNATADRAADGAMTKVDINEDMMTTWFANALMRGYDEATMRLQNANTTWVGELHELRERAKSLKDTEEQLAALTAQLDRMRTAMTSARYLMPYIKTYLTNLARVPGGPVAAVDGMQHVHTFRDFDDEGKSIPDRRFPGGKQP